MRKLIVTVLFTALILTGCAKLSDKGFEPLTEYEFEGYTKEFEITFTENETRIKDRNGMLNDYVIAQTDGYTVSFNGQKIKNPVLYSEKSLFTVGKLLKLILTEQLQSEKKTYPNVIEFSGTYKDAAYTLHINKENSMPMQFNYNGTEVIFKGN